MHWTGSRGGAEARRWGAQRKRAPCATWQTRTRVNVSENCYNLVCVPSSALIRRIRADPCSIPASGAHAPARAIPDKPSSALIRRIRADPCSIPASGAHAPARAVPDKSSSALIRRIRANPCSIPASGAHAPARAIPDKPSSALIRRIRSLARLSSLPPCSVERRSLFSKRPQHTRRQHPQQRSSAQIE